MDDKNYVLAMYDVRAKQRFIFSSQHLKEIIGGSAIIRDVFKDYLYPAANKVRDDDKAFGTNNGEAIHTYDPKKGNDRFSIKRFEDWMKGDQYLGEVIYDGGGNFLVLYRNADICKRVTAEFTRRVLQRIGTLKVICSFVDGIHPSDYIGDQKRLYTRHRYVESQQTPVIPYGTLPIVRVEYQTSMPITNYIAAVGGKDPVPVTKEAYEKYRKYAKVHKEYVDDESILDKMVTQKGDESLLAVIHIDGNSMGAKVQNCNKNDADYDNCVNNLRRFSKKIQDVFIEDRKAGIDAAIDASSGKHGRRIVIGSGDDFTIITNARDALAVTARYLQELSTVTSEYGHMSSCAGISVFHSHTPFADAYRIAEECCDHAKKVMKDKGWNDTCLIDYHFNQGVIGASLDDIREVEQTADIATPWLISKGSDHPDRLDAIPYQTVQEMGAILRIFGRGNTKGLLQAARESRGALDMEIKRIKAHMSLRDGRYQELQRREDYLYNKNGQIREEARELLIRMIPVFDIWFRKEETK